MATLWPQPSARRTIQPQRVAIPPSTRTRQLPARGGGLPSSLPGAPRSRNRRRRWLLWPCFGDYERASAVYACLAVVAALIFFLFEWFKPPYQDPYLKALYAEERYQSDIKAKEFCLKLKNSKLSWSQSDCEEILQAPFPTRPGAIDSAGQVIQPQTTLSLILTSIHYVLWNETTAMLSAILLTLLFVFMSANKPPRTPTSDRGPPMGSEVSESETLKDKISTSNNGQDVTEASFEEVASSEGDPATLGNVTPINVTSGSGVGGSRARHRTTNTRDGAPRVNSQETTTGTTTSIIQESDHGLGSATCKLSEPTKSRPPGGQPANVPETTTMFKNDPEDRPSRTIKISKGSKVVSAPTPQAEAQSDNAVHPSTKDKVFSQLHNRHMDHTSPETVPSLPSASRLFRHFQHTTDQHSDQKTASPTATTKQPATSTTVRGPEPSTTPNPARRSWWNLASTSSRTSETMATATRADAPTPSTTARIRTVWYCCSCLYGQLWVGHDIRCNVCVHVRCEYCFVRPDIAKQ